MALAERKFVVGVLAVGELGLTLLSSQRVSEPPQPEMLGFGTPSWKLP